jgi:hypothetical protein
LLALACGWIALVRVPLILNADVHLDSDLAVDGLTLLDAVNGHWRWHYPGTPHMGCLPVLLSWPQAALLGTNARTLASGGVVAYVLVVLATFVLALRAFGPVVASGALVPLAFASTGTIWLSGRITGGHLLTLAWHAAAFLAFYKCVRWGKAWRAFLLGVWCGVGLYLDQMFVATVVSIGCAAFGVWLIERTKLRGLFVGLVFVIGCVVGNIPAIIGMRADPYDPYEGQFDRATGARELTAHAWIFAWCRGIGCRGSSRSRPRQAWADRSSDAGRKATHWPGQPSRSRCLCS